MAKGSARRAKVIKAMIAFVLILALLTFFSNTIMNLTIPKVLGAYASRGNLSYSNSARGNITVDNQTEVKGLDGRVVEEVLVSNYDSVQKGDKILTLKSVEESEDLQAKKTRLKELEREKKYEARQPKDTTDYGMYQDAINTAKNALSDAKAMQKKVKNKASTVKKNNKIISDQSKKAVSYEATVNAAAQTVESLKIQIEAIDAQIAPLKSQIDVYVALGTPTPSPEELETGTSDIVKLTKKINELKAKKKDIQKQLTSAQERLDDASAKLSDCQTKIAKAQSSNESLSMLPSAKAAQNTVNQAQKSLNAANKAYKDAKIQAGITADKLKDTVNDRNEEIKKLKDDIAKLEEAAKITAITAPATGFIYNITVGEGDTLSAKDTITYILPETNRVCSVSFSFAASATQNLSVGMPLEVTSGFVEGCIVKSIKPDPDDPRGKRIVKCAVQGPDSWPGEEITVNAGKGNDNYNCVVPASAVNKDGGGEFVYMIVGSSTPLGDKYTVKRVDVTVEATDGVSSAIKGEGLDKYDVMIVIRSEKPLENGQRVRLEDYAAK